MSKPVSGSALAVGMVAAAIAALQPWTMLAIGDADVSSLTALGSDPVSSRRMFVAMLAFMPPIFIAYWIATRVIAGAFPVTASFAAFAVALWFVLELLPRSFDLLAVQGRWLPEYALADAARRAELDRGYAAYRDVLNAVGFVRRHALLLGQACLAFAFWNRGLVGRLLTLALALSVLRLALGSLALYGGFTSLFAIADPLYFVTASAIFPLLGIWFWRERQQQPAQAAR
jgi:hypothetical protein